MDTIADSKDRLYKLLPYIYQLRDADQGEPLRALLAIINEQVDVVERDIDKIYDNCFIETCEDWVVSYLGDLVGYTPVHEAGESGEVTTAQGKLRNKTLIPRREVANTIRYRRRKGSLALLEQLANGVAGWPARAVEFYKLLGWTQHVNHVRPVQGGTIDLRQMTQLANLNGPFDTLAHTVDVRRIQSHRTRGFYNIPSVGLYVWRLKTYSVTAMPITPLEQRNYYVFSALGNNTPLYTRWQKEDDPAQIAGEQNLPIAISRHAFIEPTLMGGEMKLRAASAYYGIGKSVVIEVPDWPVKSAAQPIPREHIVPADLSDWENYRPKKDTVAVDPELGRILFPPKQLPKKGATVTYHYGFSADMGGGEYGRPIAQPETAEMIYVGKDQKHKKITEALAEWKSKNPIHAVIEICDNGLYEESLPIELGEQQSLQIRAKNKTRPIIWLPERSGQFRASLRAGSFLTLDGLLIAGRGLQIDKAEGNESATDEEVNAKPIDLQSTAGIIIRHSTLVPGWTLKPNCEPDQLEEPSIEINIANPCITIEHSIVGSIHVNIDPISLDPIKIRVSDSILDATGSDCSGISCEAIGSAGESFAHAILIFLRSTVIGRVNVHAIELAENCIFKGLVKVARRQLGCMRFSYVKPNSRTPRRFNCQPDLAAQAAEEQLIKQTEQEGLGRPSLLTIAQERMLAQERTRPIFNSTRYGKPTYCQLAQMCPIEIKRGADDESEMGVFHDLYQPQREANLRARVEEYVPARADVNIILAS
jgi:hypothetical protein